MFKFIKTERDCIFNKRAGVRKIYDYRVEEDGEIAATFYKMSIGRGYYLTDARENRIRINGDVVFAPNMKGFSFIYSKAKSAGVVPTADDYKKIDAESEEKAAAYRAAEKRERRAEAIRNAAPEMFATLKEISTTGATNGAGYYVIDRLINKIETEINNG